MLKLTVVSLRASIWVEEFVPVSLAVPEVARAAVFGLLVPIVILTVTSDCILLTVNAFTY